MKFLTSWKVRPGKIQEAVERFLNEGDPIPEGVKSIGRWHRVDLEGGVHLVESDDPGLITQYSAKWSDLLELETHTVVEDAEAILALSQVRGVHLKAKGAGGR